jgi:hypothetical protein
MIWAVILFWLLKNIEQIQAVAVFQMIAQIHSSMKTKF